MGRAHYDVVIIGSGAGGGTMARALAGSRRAHPRARAGRLRAAGGRELGPGRRLEAPPLPDHRALARRPGTRVPAVHALRRGRQHEVLGQRALPPAPRGLPGTASTSTACRPRGRSTTTRWRRTTIAPSGSTRSTAQHGIDPTEPPRGPYPHAPIPHAPAMAAIVEQLEGAWACIPSPLPLGLIRPGEPGGCVLCNTCNSFPCRIHAKSDAEVCGVRPALRASQRQLWTRARARRLLDRPVGRDRIEAVEVERDGQIVRVGASLVRRLLRRGQLGRPAAALGERPAPGRPGQLVGPGRPPLHGAPGDDDAGVPSVPAERDTCSRRRSPSTTSTCAAPATDFPLGQIQSQGRTHGVMAQTVAPWIPLWAYDGVGGARRGLARDVRGPAATRTTA